MTSFVRKQLVIFTALSVAAFAIIAFGYVKVPTLLGAGQIQVTARIPEAGGIYPNANVTYRGYTIGKVKEVTLVPGAVDVRMSIDESLAPPANSYAHVQSVSAIGEQFVDFVPPDSPEVANASFTGEPGSAPPASATEPLADGAFIPESHTSIPTPTANVLNEVNGLLATVDKQDLDVVLREFDAAFRGIGPQLSSIADNARLLLDSADAAYPQTEQLIRDAEPFLDSQIASADNARAWSRQLASVTEQLKQSDGDLRGALRNGQVAAEQAGNFLDRLRGPLPGTLDNTIVLTELAQAYNAPIEQVLVVYPALQSFYQAALGPNTREQINFNIKLNPNRPACYEGWVGPGAEGGPRDAFELSDMPFPDDQYCQLPQNDERLVRGSRNLPCFEPDAPANRRAATVQQCREGGFVPTTTKGTQLPIGGALSDAPLFIGQTPAVPVDLLGPGAQPGAAPEDLRGLLLPG
ncbi:MCE family protein [Pseudonocardia xishanensis]|uniref:Phospholipid/cholesterol/gamma-HCH transport system substrate-binding protein n=1 Tax=Pseudonocardia xishanensis TaxID=630995 RepID=A0ABP8RV46_9PSEU